MAVIEESREPHGASFHDYNRTVIGYHGTTAEAAEKLVDGDQFNASSNDDDWFGKGIYFWEYAPKQAWWWTTKLKRMKQPAVVGAIVRLGHCLDLLDPTNVLTLKQFHDETLLKWKAANIAIPKNGNQHKNLDCALFNLFYDQSRVPIETARAVYVPTESSKRAWKRSWIYEEAHIQICVRQPKNILAVWRVRKDGSYGKDHD
ncbi:MAG TPA: hypothetical protein VFC78_24230 [Tepidisphaeraceae bacterium]|nr:hypothetical protein [Tepidisphaeraceae bacterium]